MKSLTLNRLLLTTALCLYTLHAQAVLEIHPKPVDAEHQHDRRAAKVFTLNDATDGVTVQLWTPDLQSSELRVDNGQIAVKPTGKNNYHLLVATHLYNNVHETAIRYVPFNGGSPTGHSPSELTSLDKAPLDIVPDPLPREHWHYKAGDTIRFSVRFKQQPLAFTDVNLTTSQGTSLASRTDNKGRVSFTLADDFPETKPGRRNNQPAELLVQANYSQGDVEYTTWLSADYQVDPSHWRKTNLGVLVASGGFIFGAFVTGLGFRTARNTPKKNTPSKNSQKGKS